MTTILNENKKIISDYINKNLPKEYEGHKRRILGIQKELEKQPNAQKSAELEKLEKEGEKKWGEKQAYYDYLLIAKRCMKLYADAEKNQDGMLYEDYQRLKKYTDTLSDKDTIKKIKQNIPKDHGKNVFTFVTLAFREMDVITKNWEFCHGKKLEQVFPIKTADFEMSKYSEMGNNILNINKMKKSNSDIKEMVESLKETNGKFHSNSKEFNNMITTAIEATKKMEDLFEERSEREYIKNRNLSMEDSEKIFQSIQTAKEAICKYMEAKGGIGNQKTDRGKDRMGMAMELYHDLLAAENLCVTKDVIEASQKVWSALSPKKEIEKVVPEMVRN